MSLREKVLSWGNDHDTPDEKLLKEFRIRINNDLNTPQVIALLWEVADSSLTPEKKRATLLEFDRVLSLGLASSSTREIPEEVMALVQERESLRKKGWWKESDRMRQEILKRGYEVRDTPVGPKVVRKGL